MECRRCATPLDRPGDYCLVCGTANADAVVVDAGVDRAELTMLDGEDVVGRTAVAASRDPDAADPERTVALRNYAGRVADEMRRKRPDAVFAAGDRDVVQAVRRDLHHDVYRVPADDPVETVLARRGDRDLEVVEKPPGEKIGGSHSTLIGGRTGQRAIQVVAGHPNVKKVIPGPIDGGGSHSSTGVRAKVTRADENGNVRLVVHDGSSIQENRVVTTAMDRDTGERVRDDCNEALADEELQ
jgi:hypothetical protein